VQMKVFLLSLWQKQNWFWEFLSWWYLWFVACIKCTNTHMFPLSLCWKFSSSNWVIPKL
jgi:hypothetical protein